MPKTINNHEDELNKVVGEVDAVAWPTSVANMR